MESELPQFLARLSADGHPQVEHDGQVETFIVQKTPQLNAMDAIVRAACAAVAGKHEQARIVYDPALEPVLAVFRAPADQLPGDPAAAGLRKTYELAAHRVRLTLVPGVEAAHGG